MRCVGAGCSSQVTIGNLQKFQISNCNTAVLINTNLFLPNNTNVFVFKGNQKKNNRRLFLNIFYCIISFTVTHYREHRENMTLTQHSITIFPPYLNIVHSEVFLGMTVHAPRVSLCLPVLMCRWTLLLSQHVITGQDPWLPVWVQDLSDLLMITDELMINQIRHEKYLHVSWCYDSRQKIKAHFHSVVQRVD